MNNVWNCFLIKIMKCEKFLKCKKLFEKFSQIDYTNKIEKQTKKNIQTMIIDEKSIEKNEMKKSSNNTKTLIK